jgi:hypothetical protein
MNYGATSALLLISAAAISIAGAQEVKFNRSNRDRNIAISVDYTAAAH